MFMQRTKISSLDFYFKGSTSRLIFSRTRGKKAGRISMGIPVFWTSPKFSYLKLRGPRAFNVQRIWHLDSFKYISRYSCPCEHHQTNQDLPLQLDRRAKFYSRSKIFKPYSYGYLRRANYEAIPKAKGLLGSFLSFFFPKMEAEMCFFITQVSF